MQRQSSRFAVAAIGAAAVSLAWTAVAQHAPGGAGMPGHAPPAPGQAMPGPAATEQAPALPADDRALLTLTAGERDFVLNEMRNFLLSVQGIVAALADGKPGQAAAAARASGMGTTHGVPRSLMMKLPQEFRQLGMDTHKRFDTLALEAEGMGDRQQILSQLAAILANCNGCHASYRLAAQ